MHPETITVREGFHHDPQNGACIPPIYLTNAYQFNDCAHAERLFELKELGWIYTRLQNPTTDILERRMAALEGGIGAVATSSGAHAIAVAILNLVHSGDHLIASQALYGGTLSQLKYTLKRIGVETTFVDLHDPNEIKKHVRPRTKAVFYESLANPKNEVFEYEKIAEVAHECGLPVICDNTVLTPFLFRPFDHGADITVYSTTKMIGGHGATMGGMIIDSGRFDWSREPEKWPQFTQPDPAYHGTNFFAALGDLCYIITCRTHWLRDFGGCASPMNSFFTLQGLETLHLRAPRHSESALKVATWLESHPKVRWVNYPHLASHKQHSLAKRYFPKGCGAILGFGIEGGRAAGERFIGNVELALHVANICDARTLVIHPATTTHSQLGPEELAAAGVGEDYIRVSVGLESPDDIIADLKQAIDKACG
ncbi:MAG: O-acetylhomoserine aminocarboxypropyltransferase/cysteine synthase family protein [Thermoguttaceae bacterium]